MLLLLLLLLLFYDYYYHHYIYYLVCNYVETEPVLQEITGETLNSGANLACDARLDIHARHVDFGKDKSQPFLI